jgi:hypothetical protein
MKSKIHFILEVDPNNNYSTLVNFVYDSLQFKSERVYEMARDGERIINKYPEMIFKIIIVMLEYGILVHLEDIKKLV